MKSQHLLTRQLFRAILANRPYRIPECPLQPLAHSPYNQRRSFRSSQRRQIFGLGFGSSIQSLSGSKPTSANLEAALSKLVDFLNAKRTQSRPPSDEELVDAFRFLFSARTEKHRPLTRTEAHVANEALQFLRSKDRVLSETNAASLTTQDIHNVLAALAAPAGREVIRSEYQALATSVLDILRQHPELNPLVSTQTSDAEEALRYQCFEAYITVLTRTGSSSEALALLHEVESPARHRSPALWVTTLKGLGYEGRTHEIGPALSEMKKNIGPLDASSHEELCHFFAEKNDVENTIEIFETGLAGGPAPTSACLSSILSFAIRNAKASLAAEVAAQLRTRTDVADETGILLAYYATLDPSANNLKKRISELAEIDADIVNMPAMNALVKYAYAKRDPALAQNYIDMARSFGLRPDASTWLSRLDFELSKGDLDAAAEAFDALTLENVPKDRSDIPILNRYITVLSCAETPSQQHLMRVLDSILETGADLEPSTVTSLCRVFLRRDEMEEISGLLRYRIGTFPRADREQVASSFEDFIFDLNVKDQRAYNAYDLLRHAFPETPVERRIEIMNSFFKRDRPDRACLVFGHMRQRDDPDARPTAEAYAQCFAGIAKCKDFDGLQMVYNMLKMDTYVNPNTRIHNALMQAYTACRAPFTSIIDHFWKILDSRNGPTMGSFLLALQACETWVPQGSQEARKIMALMQSWNLIITKEIYDCYIGAVAGQSEFENTVELIQHMQEDIGEAPDAYTIGTFYNAIPFQYRKDAVEKWAKEAYPQLWEELEGFADEIDEEWEIRYFKIDRTIDLSDDLLFGPGEYRPELVKEATLAIEEPRAKLS